MLHKNIPYRRWQDYLHTKRLAEIASYCGYPGVWYKNEKYYISCRSSGASQFLKRQSNKCIRGKYKKWDENKIALHGGEYKKLFDFWWQLT